MLGRLSATLPTPGAHHGENEALTWLYSLADAERGIGWNPASNPEESWKIGRTRALLDLSGAPDRDLTCVLVAGTKGKGSTAAILASILDAASIRSGLYTQPHLQVYRERIRVDGVAIAPAHFARVVSDMQRLVRGLRTRWPEAGEPTTFEVTTVAALRHFAERRCRVAVLEVGLGGRLDATNATDPAASVITPISRDHSQILGATLAAIAREKAGILRRGCPGLIALQRPSAARALWAVCRQVGARCTLVSPLAVASGGDGVVIPGIAGTRPLALAGDHQRQNAALAVAAALALQPMLGPMPAGAIAEGLGRVRWPGRFEVVEGDPPVVLDGAHNGASALALARTVAAYAAGRPLFLVLGIFRDKPGASITRALVPLASATWATSSGLARSFTPLEVARIARRATQAPVHVAEEVEEATRAAREEASRVGGIVLVTGSLAVVGAARNVLGLAPPERLWAAEVAASDQAASKRS